MSKQSLTVLLLSISLVVMGYFLFNALSELKSVNNSLEVLESGFENQKKEILELEGSLNEDQKKLDKILDSLKLEHKNFEKDIKKINKNSDEAKNAIRFIHSVDSLTRLLTERYKQK